MIEIAPEFLVNTFGDSMAAIRKFAGESAESAVVEPEARAVSAEYGDFVRHYEMISRILAQILLAMLFIALPLSASADSFHDIAVQARAKYVAAQESWQRELAELVTRTNPDFRAIATVQRDLQVAYVELRTARFRYLLAHDSSRIILTNGISGFANFEWTDADTKALAESDPAYVQLQRRITTKVSCQPGGVTQ